MLLTKFEDVSYDWLFRGEGPMRRGRAGEQQDAISPAVREKPSDWGPGKAVEELQEEMRQEKAQVEAQLQELRRAHDKLIYALAVGRSGREMGFTETASTEEAEEEKRRTRFSDKPPAGKSR